MDAPIADAPSFGTWLKQRRKSLDLTQEQLADRIGCSLATVAKIEAGERRPSHQMAELLAECLRISPGEREAFLRLARECNGSLPVPPVLSDHGPIADATRTPKQHPTNLPAPFTSFLGREQQVEEVQMLLRETRLITLTGPPGIGKTRLAIQVASALLADFEDGVFFVSLAPITDPSLVATAIASELGLRDTGTHSPLEILKEHLRDKSLLLVLDNFEQVIGAARAVSSLLAACAGIKALVTSRQALGVYGEQQFPVPPLGLPRPDDLRCLRGDPSTAVDIECLHLLSGYASVTLFVERAHTVSPSFRVTEGNARAVAAICARLDGLPLAIELAAARVKMLPPHALLARLSSRLKTLVGGAVDLSARQQTLGATLDWSYDLLNPAEKQLFRRMAVFSGGCSLAGVEAVCNYDGLLGEDALAAVESLVNKSLAQRDEARDLEPRCTMLETIREYAAGKLQESGEASIIEKAHAEYYLALAEAAEPFLTAHGQAIWLDRLERDHDNVRAALAWALGHGEAEIALRLCTAAWRFWMIRGYLSEGRQWLGKALSCGEDCLPQLRAPVLLAAGKLAEQQTDLAEAVRVYEESLAILRQSGDRAALATALSSLGYVRGRLGDYDHANRLYPESLEIRRALGDVRGTAVTLHNWARLHYEQGDYKLSNARCLESLALFRQCGDEYGICATLNRLGEGTRLAGDLESPRAYYEESLAMARRVGVKEAVAANLACLVILDAASGTSVQSFEPLVEAIGIFQEMGELWNVGVCLGIFGMLAAGQEQPVRAARLFGAMETTCLAGGAPPERSDRTTLDPFIKRARAQLGEFVFDCHMEAGRAMNTEEALAYALEQPAPSHE